MILVTILHAAAAIAATPSVLDIRQVMKQNEETLKQYSYKRRTEVTVKGKILGTRVDLIRYVEGRMESVPLESPVRPRQSPSPRRLRGKIIEDKIARKKKQITEERERLENLLHTYLSSDAMRTEFEKASISRTGQGRDAAEVKMVATGIVKPADSFTLIWSVANGRPVSIDIRTELDGKPVQLTLEYATVRSGPFYAARTVISSPKSDSAIRIDTFDYNGSGTSQ
jgi:hypothetical protein